MFGNNDYFEYSAGEVDEDVNLLPTIRAAIKTAYPDYVMDNHEAAINAIELRSATAFTVRLNPQTSVTAQLTGMGDYAVISPPDDGTSVTEIVFPDTTTLTLCRVGWYRSPQNFYLTTIATIPSGGSIDAITDGIGGTYYPDADDKYELMKGGVYVTATVSSVTDTQFCVVDGSGATYYRA